MPVYFSDSKRELCVPFLNSSNESLGIYEDLEQLESALDANQNSLYKHKSEMKNLINLRFGPGTWEFILQERKKRIDAKKQAIKEAKAARLKKQQEIAEYIKMGLLVTVIIAFIAVALGITFKFFVSVTNKVYAHNIEQDDGSCRLYEPKYFYICMNEGREWADMELYLDQKKMRGNWIEIEEE